MWLEILIPVAVVFSIVFYRWATKNHDFFKKRNIPYEKPAFMFGGSAEIILRKKSMFQVQCEIYNRHNGLVYGIFDNRDPMLLLRDPHLIKRVMIKDFDHFVNRRSFFEEAGDNLFTNSIFLMENDKWRDMRNTLTPAFTGSKMRQMFQLILQTLDDAVVYLKQRQSEVSNVAEGFEVDVKAFTTRLSNDIIATTAFGLQVNSLQDEDNEFYRKAKSVVNFTAFQQLKSIFLVMLPRVAEFFKIELFGKEFVDYFMRLVLDTMKYRAENNIRRPDMIDLLMEARGMLPGGETTKAHHREWSDVEVVGQCFIFFFAAMEPLSSTMSFAAHELMEFAEVQEKLLEEIQEIDEQLQGKQVTYELLQKMPYLDAVVAEVLRKWPVTLFTDRTCSKDYVYEAPETGERIEIRKGDLVRIGMCAIQRDPKYFEDPDVLNPQRFSELNKAQIDSGTYLPFGLGPRNCIGNRFALLIIKAFLYNIVRDYRLEPSPKTGLPLVMDSSTFQLRPKKGFWIQFKPRK